MNSIHLILVGDELLSGKRQDRHLMTLAADLARRGAKVETCEVIRDVPGAVTDAVKRHLKPGAIVVTTGGLGPTLDDLTREGISQATGVGLVENPDLWERLKRYFEKSGRKISESNRSQTLVPERGTFFPNTRGTAPGLVFEPEGIPRCRVVALPGPPREMVPMWHEQVVPYLAREYTWPPLSHEILLRFAMVGESKIDEKMRPLLQQHPEVALSSLIRAARVDVTLSVPSDAPGGAESLREISGKTQRLFERSIYEVREWLEEERSAPREIEEVVADLLRERGQTVAVAESCTGGLLGKYLTDFAGSSDVFVGGIVSYSNEMKRSLLGVSEKTLTDHGAVSAETAAEMVEGLLARAGADWGVSLTGIAGPGGGTDAKPVGLVWIGAGTRAKIETHRYVFSGDRAMVRERAVVASLRMLWLRLRGMDDGQ